MICLISGAAWRWAPHRFCPKSMFARLESAITAFNENLPPLKEFILPGGSPLIGLAAMWPRTVCRRAERSLVAMGGGLDGPDYGRQYLNRLSDLLFVAARYEARRADLEEIFWKPGGASD